MPEPVETISFSSKFAGDLIRFASRRGADEGSLLSILSLPPEYQNREDIRIPARKMAEVWSKAMHQCSDPILATRMGQQAFSAQQTTNLIMQSSTSVREAFELAVRYSSLIANVMSTSLSEDDLYFYLEFKLTAEWQLEDAAVVRDCLQIAMVAAMNSIRQITGSPHQPAVVTFTLSPPRFSNALFEIFNCPIRFNNDRNCIGFGKEVQKTELASKDLGLQAVIRQYADDLRQRYENSRSWTDKVRTHLIEHMPHPLTLSQMAQQLSISERSLQRRLKLEHTTYRQIVEEVRLTFVASYAGQSHRSLDEVAYLSGYCDAPTMIRAYKRKFGKAPRAR